jgi:tRNA threonylcarbamoyladenosine biosynthesis protein TsaE
VLLLQGPFGAGKTTLVQGIARGLGVQGYVTSPSFVIANEYPGRIPLYHVDLYRVEEMDATTLEALAEYFDGPGLCVVEWPGPLPPDLTEGAARILLEVTGDETRRLTLDKAPPHLADPFQWWAARGEGRAGAPSGRL